MFKQPLGQGLLGGFLATLFFALVLAQPWATQIDFGGLWDAPYLRNFHNAEYSKGQQVSFRWSRPEAALILPGAGKVSALGLRVHGDYVGQKVQLDLGKGPISLTLRTGWQDLALLPVPDSWSGDLTISLLAPKQTSLVDRRERGLVLDWVKVQGERNAPPLGQALLLGLSTTLVILLASWAWRRERVGNVVGATFAPSCAILLLLDNGAWRLMLTDYTGRLVLVLALGGMIGLGSEFLLRRLPKGLLPSPLQSQRPLATAVLLAFLLRFGGMAYPLNFISDIRFHLARASMVRDGKFLMLFLPNPSLTPTQWQADIPIPYSPLYYVLTAPFTFLKGDADNLGMMSFSSFADALAVLLTGIFVRLGGGSWRGASQAAFLAATLPFGLLVAVSWGLFPTLLGQSLALAAIVAWLACVSNLHERRVQILLTFSLTLTFLAYPTALLFLGTTWAILLLLLLCQRDPATKPTFLIGLTALGMATLLYYGWHIPAMFQKTLPVLAERLTVHQPKGTSFDLYQQLLKPIWRPLQLKYGLEVLGLATGGAFLLAAKQGHERRRYARLLLIAWFLTYLPMALASKYVVTFILKDVLYLLPALALLSGLLLGEFERYRWGKISAKLIMGLIFWEGFVLELHEIVYAFGQLK